MKKKAFFLDRDGVINGGHSLNKAHQLTLLKGVPQAIKALNESGYQVFVVTNQGGVGLGYTTRKDLDAIHDELERQVGEVGGRFDGIKACTHKPKEGCSCRKPKPGMILEFAKEHSIDLEQSYMVGDRDVDIQAGEKAGVRTVFITSSPDAPVTFVPKPDYVFTSLHEAVETILAKETGAPAATISANDPMTGTSSDSLDKGGAC